MSNKGVYLFKLADGDPTTEQELRVLVLWGRTSRYVQVAEGRNSSAEQHQGQDEQERPAPQGTDPVRVTA